MSIDIGPWWVLAMALPVLFLGEALARRIPLLSKYNIPVPVIGGLSVASVALALHAAGVSVAFELQTTSRWWLWLVTPEPALLAESTPGQAIYYPLMVAFFACIGLNAHASVLRKGGWAVALYLVATTLLAALQAAGGVAVARGLDQPPLLGLLCGTISMTGGHATSAAFAPLVEEAGLSGALEIAITAATFGLVVGGLVGGPVGAFLIRRRRLSKTPETLVLEQSTKGVPTTFLSELSALVSNRHRLLWHVGALAISLKLGAWVSYGLASIPVAGEPIVLPGYIGAMIVAIVLRNGLELTGQRWIRDDIVLLMMFVCLDLFLAVAIMSVDLTQLAAVGKPMLIILTAQICLMVVFAATVTFRMMGADYNAAVLAAGHCGFGLGASPNAVANMESIVKQHGPAPEAFLVLPIAAGFLLDFTNAAVIIFSIRLLS